MDEPFGALDAQTRAQMQSYLLQIWKQVDVTILFITHDLDEAIYLADRILVLDAHPGRVREIMEVPVPRPRTPEQFLSPTFMAARRHLEELIHPAGGASTGPHSHDTHDRRGGRRRMTATRTSITTDPGAATETLRGGSAWSRRMRRGQVLRLTDPTGRAAVAALFFNAADPLERYNMPDTLKAQYTAFLTAGRVLYSDMGRILARSSRTRAAGTTRSPASATRRRRARASAKAAIRSCATTSTATRATTSSSSSASTASASATSAPP